MRALRNLLFLTVITTAGIWAAERIVVHRVHLDSPMGTDTGHLIATGDNLIFVDDTDTDMSFTIPKADITTLHLNNGVITMNLSRPFTNMYGSRSDVVLNLDPASAQIIANWAGLPLTGYSVERSRTAVVPVAEQFNVKHDDDNGRLLVGSERIEWQNLAHTNKSHTWTYSDIKSFTRNRADRELKLKTYSGDEFKFKVLSPDMNDDVYNMIADRIVASRH